MPHLIYSSFPQNAEMLWTLSLLLTGDVTANVLGWMMSLLGAAAVYLFAKRYLGPSTAKWAAVFLTTMPAYMLLSSGGYIDVPLAVFSFVSFYAICLWMDSRQTSVLILAGALAGWAMGIKYTGAIPFGIGGLVILKEKGRTWRDLLIYLGMGLVVFCPWLAKNLHYVGNPVFPFLYKWNLRNLNPWTADAAAGYFRGLVEYEPRSGSNLIKLLWDIGVHGMDFGGGMDVLGDLGWGLLVVFLPALLLIKERASKIQLLFFYAVCFFVPWGMSRPVLRFLLPLAPVLAVLAAYAYEHGVNTQPPMIRVLGRSVLALLWISNLWLFFQVSDILSLFRVPMGFESRTDYLLEKLDYYGAASFLQSLPDNSLTYVVGDQRGYYYNKPVIVTPVFNTNPLAAWANQASSPEEFAALIKAQHITHLLINNNEFRRLEASYHLFPFTARGQSNWDQLRTRLAKALYHDKACDVYAL
jgi:4-amino-4-deoxy-L-arabinose transferase-like glycosyltransferase